MQGLTIYLGSHCNLSCPYCHREADENEPAVDERLLTLVRGRSDLRIRFMGGEPTLYMNDIKKVVDAAPRAKFSICTNGTTLKKLLPYFREHRFLVCVSYDGTGLRGYDPFTALVDYPWLAVSCTLYHRNTDMGEIIKRFAEKEKLIGRTLSFFPHIAHVTGKHNEAFGLTYEDAADIVRQYREMIGEYMDERARFGVANKRYEGMFCGLVRAYNAHYTFGETYCFNRRLHKCDAAGRLFPCLYIRQRELSGKNWQNEMQQVIYAKSPLCLSCGVYDMCGGACIVSESHDVECFFYRELYTWFRSAYEKFLSEGGARA